MKLQNYEITRVQKYKTTKLQLQNYNYIQMTIKKLKLH